MYLDNFKLPIDREDKLIRERMIHNGGPHGYIDNLYPCGIFSEKRLREINFDRITVFYGENGSGKSTLLNLIAHKLGLHRAAPFNSSELFDIYARECSYSAGYDDNGDRYQIPAGSSIITSDDVFDYMLAVRTNNQDIAENIEEAREEWAGLKFGRTVKFGGMEDYEKNRLQVLARRKSLTRRQFIKKTAGEEIKLGSNGETALTYFDSRLKNDMLYCLDEPENSLAPRLALELVEIIGKMARYCGCQFILATHSPFFLSLPGARIYDLDETPVDIKNWWELENAKIYFEFFWKHRNLF
ncbi:MAG: AAA family ATPase [Lachnospiraceae bacterium]|nr:AAA family ATPase [Lachnospiraceae bacterium]